LFDDSSEHPESDIGTLHFDMQPRNASGQSFNFLKRNLPKKNREIFGILSFKKPQQVVDKALIRHQNFILSAVRHSSDRQSDGGSL
jgi:hypothetical protein